MQKEEERRERKNSIVKHDDPALLVTRVHFNDSVTVISEKIRRHERGGSFIFCNWAGAPEALLALWIFPHS